MNNSQKIKDFIEKTNERLELIDLSLLKHEKNPKDREFLNDIFRSMRSIRNSALKVRFGRISELAFHMAGLLDLICQEKLELDDDIHAVMVAVKDRIAQLVREVETSRNERTTVKDLLDRIRGIEEQVSKEKFPAPDGMPEAAATGKPPAAGDSDQTLLPDEIKKEEYDPELYQIYLDQTQEHLSLLRSLTNGYPDAADKAHVVSLCSDLVGKLQTSAHYMGYDRLADFYLQWVAELEMMGVELSVGSPVSFDFMDTKIKRVAALFPQIKDMPAEPSLLEKTAPENDGSSAGNEPEKNEDSADGELLKDLFSRMEDDGGRFDDNAGPIAALSDYEPDGKARVHEPLKPKTSRLTKKLPAGGAVIDLDASFLEEERQSDEFDEELFQIFVQQLQENLSQLRTLTNSYQATRYKSQVIDLCSDLVGRLQSSANYMGYEPLAEYYLQWIAELEMAGVDLSLGKKVSFAFMDERIRKIAGLFPDIEDIPAMPYPGAAETGMTMAGMADKSPASDLEDADFPESLKGLFSTLDEPDEDTFDDNAESIAALSDREPPGGEKRPISAPAASAESPTDEDLFSGFDDEIREDVQVSPPADDPSRSALLRKLSDALKSLDEEPAAGGSEIPLPEKTFMREELDPGLYQRLLDALESTAENADRDDADPVEQVMEEILTGSFSAPDHAAAALHSAAPGARPPDAGKSVGVDGDGTDTHMNNVGELVASRSSLARLYSEMTSFQHVPMEKEDMDPIQLKPLKDLIIRLGDADMVMGSVPNEITAGLLKIRMIPVRHLFSLYQDVVAEKTRGADKQIKLEMVGEETEIDQGMVEDMAKCLLPIVVNAVTHGIETAAERRLAGKNTVGSLRLAAYRDLHHLVVEVADDGRGIDPGKIKAAALAGKMYTADELYTMSDDELTGIIMSPNFTTAADAAAPDHGAGMDSVRAIVDQLNGSIRVKSTVGKGTLIELRIPLRIPIFKALKFTVGAGNFAVPLSGVEEVLRQDAGQLTQGTDGEFILFRGENIPVFPLSRLIKMEPAGQRGERVHIVIVSAGTGKAGLIVDSIIGLEEVVIKPLAEYLGKGSGLGAAAGRDKDDIFSIPDIDGMMQGVPDRDRENSPA